MTSSAKATSTDLQISKVSLLSSTIAIPFGQVTLFGNTNNVFAPGAGFDIYYTLQDDYVLPPRLPALPGVTADIIATVRRPTA